MFSSKPRWDQNKCKVQLKMLLNRLNLLLQKQTNLAKAEKRTVATLLRDQKELNARIKVEQIIRSDYKLESFEVIKGHAELLIARFNVLLTDGEIKPEIIEAVTALVYSGYVLGSEVPELNELYKLFTAKYGKEWCQEVITNKDKYLNHRLNRMLSSTQVPDDTVVEAYLTEIAKTYGVEYVPTPNAGKPAAVSATTGIALPLPGMAMGSVPAPIDPATLGMGETPGADPPPSNPYPNVAVPQTFACPPVTPAATAPAPPPIEVKLTKRSPDGFGLSMDAENVVTAVKTPDANTKVAVGDRIIAFNGTSVSAEHPVRKFAIHEDEGGTATFTLLRVAGISPAGAGAAGAAGSSSLPALMDAASEWRQVLDKSSSTPYFWNPVTNETRWETPPEMGGAAPPQQPTAETPPPPGPAPLPAAGVPLVTAVAVPPMGVEMPPGPPPDAQTPTMYPMPSMPTAMPAMPAMPPAPDDPDDILAKRLAALKR